jgi:ribosome biogenesis GTP-binding protein YlqF
MGEQHTTKNNINWFPGHMAKTRRKITEDLKMVDVVAELTDARIPQSSRNPILRDIVQKKPMILLLNKSDMADPIQTKKWVEEYKNQGISAIPLDAKNGRGIPEFYNGIRELLKEQIAVWEGKGMIGRPLRIMVLGIPNVGKSSLINRLIGSGRAGKAEVRDKPGVTRQNRWFTVKKGFELLDTPGVLWPKFEDQEVGRLLAYTGAIKDEVLDMETLASNFLEYLMKIYPNAINERYKTQIDVQNPPIGYEILTEIGRKRGMLISGGEIDTERAATAVMDEFRGAKLGRITLEQA